MREVKRVPERFESAERYKGRWNLMDGGRKRKRESTLYGWMEWLDGWVDEFSV